MRKSFFSVALGLMGMLLFSGCANDDVMGVDKNVDYRTNFEKVFGQVSPAQNFNTQRTVTIDATLADAQGSYTLSVYDAKPGTKGASLLGKFENLKASSTTVKVGVSKSAKNIYCVADNGEVRTVVSAPVSSSARVTAKFDAADGAPTNGQTDTDDQLSTVTIAFEDLGSTDDFDFNDAVVKVEYATGTGMANVTLMAVGAVLPLKLYYAGGRDGNVPLFDGQELHAAMGAQDVHTIINTNWKTAQGIAGADNVAFVTCEIEVPQDFTIGEDGAPFILEVNGTEGQRQITASTEYGAVPQVLVTGKYYDEQARTSYFWRWPKERVRLNLAFPGIEGWMADPDDLSFLAGGVEDNLYDGYDPTVVDEQQQPATGTPEGLEAVDLGLPSETLWANMNVGATSPEDYGGYYAWGETEEKDYYDWSTYTHCDGSYDTCHDLGSDIAGTEYDTATANWGSDWQMPTLDQIQELIDNTTSEWTQVNGVNGRKFTSTAAGNSNSIFLPASGYRWGGDLYDAGNNGYYWSSTQDPSYSYGACELNFYSDDTDWYYYNRYYGRSVRPVARN